MMSSINAIYQHNRNPSLYHVITKRVSLFFAVSLTLFFYCNHHKNCYYHHHHHHLDHVIRGTTSCLSTTRSSRSFFAVTLAIETNLVMSSSSSGHNNNEINQQVSSTHVTMDPPPSSSSSSNEKESFLFLNPKPGYFIVPVQFPKASTTFSFSLHNSLSYSPLSIYTFCAKYKLIVGQCRYFLSFLINKVRKQAEVITNGITYYAPTSKFESYLAVTNEEEDDEEDAVAVNDHMDSSNMTVLRKTRRKKHKLSHSIPYESLKRHNSAMTSEMNNVNRLERVKKAEEIMYREIAVLQHIKSFIDIRFEQESALYLETSQKMREKMKEDINNNSPQRKKRKHYHHRAFRSIAIDDLHNYDLEALQLQPLVPLSRIAVIHSCLLPGMKDTRILSEILDRIYATPTLHSQLSIILVLHYGDSLTSIEGLTEKYTEVTFINVSPDISFFEVPSIRLVHAMAIYLHEKRKSYNALLKNSNNHDIDNVVVPMADTQILYMHTKGVSYQERYPSIEEWRDFMLYYHIDRHHHAYHLLHSNAFDVIGLTFHRTPRLVIGNYWWSKVSYIHKLHPLQYSSADKYSAEAWLLSATSRVRYYHSHFSWRDQAVGRYPRYCYTSTLSETMEFPSIEEIQATIRMYEENDREEEAVDGGNDHRRASDDASIQMKMVPTGPLPTYKQWSSFCGNSMSETYYNHIHRIPMEISLTTAVDQLSKHSSDLLCVSHTFGSKPKEW